MLRINELGKYILPYETPPGSESRYYVYDQISVYRPPEMTLIMEHNISFIVAINQFNWEVWIMVDLNDPRNSIFLECDLVVGYHVENARDPPVKGDFKLVLMNSKCEMVDICINLREFPELFKWSEQYLF